MSKLKTLYSFYDVYVQIFQDCCIFLKFYLDSFILPSNLPHSCQIKLEKSLPACLQQKNGTKSVDVFLDEGRSTARIDDLSGRSSTWARSCGPGLL